MNFARPAVGTDNVVTGDTLSLGRHGVGRPGAHDWASEIGVYHGTMTSEIKKLALSVKIVHSHGRYFFHFPSPSVAPSPSTRRHGLFLQKGMS
jgi:hypothetical protein